MQKNKSEHFELKSFRNNQVSNRERRGDPRRWKLGIFVQMANNSPPTIKIHASRLSLYHPALQINDLTCLFSI